MPEEIGVVKWILIFDYYLFMKPLHDTNGQKQTIVKIFLLVAILSAGISIVANVITKDAQSWVIIVPGIVCILLVAYFYVKDYFGRSSYRISIDTALCVDKEKMPIPIDRFRYSEDLCRVVKSVLSENKAYCPLWKDSLKWNTGAGGKVIFIDEFYEYLFVHWISLRLNSYFCSFDESAIDHVRREQMPEVLIKNRVIELISKPFNEREKFQKFIEEDNQEAGEVCMIQGEDNVLFNKLEIELPRKSSVVRDGKALVIKNRDFEIRFESRFDGFGYVLPSHFERFYMNRRFDEVDCFKVDLDLSVKLKPFFFLSVKDWRYLGWLDQLEDEFLEYFCFKTFVKRIGFEQAATDHIIFLNGLKCKEDNKHNNKQNYSRVSIIKVDAKNENNN